VEVSERHVTPDEYFDEQWARGDDPWEHATRWYETRKYQLTVAALPRPRYRRSFEPGCGPGVLTRALGERSEDHLAMERHPAGAAAARRRCADRPTVRVKEGVIPDDWPGGRFDLIVLSEVLYYLGGDAIDACLAHAHRSLVVGGHLVAVHYRRHVDAHRWTGDEVHDRLAAAAGWTSLLRGTDVDFRLDALERC